MKILLITLHFLRHYPTVDAGSILWGVSPHTYRRYIWGTLKKFSNIHLISWQDRLTQDIRGHFENCLTIIDSTECPI